MECDASFCQSILGMSAQVQGSKLVYMVGWAGAAPRNSLAVTPKQRLFAQCDFSRSTINHCCVTARMCGYQPWLTLEAALVNVSQLLPQRSAFLYLQQRGRSRISPALGLNQFLNDELYPLS